MSDDTRSVTVDKRNRVSLGDLVEPGQEYVAWKNEHGQIVMAPSVRIVRTPENAQVLDEIGAFLKDPSTGVRRARPQRRTQADADRVSGFLADGIRAHLPRGSEANGA